MLAIAGAALLAPAATCAAEAPARPQGQDQAATDAAAPAPATARRAPRRDGAVTLDAASSDVDYRSNTVLFRDIVITQGGVRVAAARARATGLDFDDSTWTFSGAVRITVDGGATYAVVLVTGSAVRTRMVNLQEPNTLLF